MPVINAPTNTTPREDLQGSIVKGSLDFQTSATQILRPLPQSKSKGIIDIITRKSTMQKVKSGIVRTRGGGFKTIDFERAEQTFRTITYGVAVAYDDKDRADFENDYGYEVHLTKLGGTVVLREQEARINSLFETGSNFPAGTRGASLSNTWSNQSSGTPRSDVSSALEDRYKATGMKTGWNLCLTYMSLLHLFKSNDIVANRKYTANARTFDEKVQMVTEELMVDGVILVGGRYDSADEGQTESMSDLWTTTKAALVRVAQSEDPSEPCLGRTIYNDEFGGLFTVAEYYDTSVLSKKILSYQDVVEVAFDLECGYVFQGVA